MSEGESRPRWPEQAPEGAPDQQPHGTPGQSAWGQQPSQAWGQPQQGTGAQGPSGWSGQGQGWSPQAPQAWSPQAQQGWSPQAQPGWTPQAQQGWSPQAQQADAHSSAAGQPGWSPQHYQAGHAGPPPGWGAQAPQAWGQPQHQQQQQSGAGPSAPQGWSGSPQGTGGNAPGGAQQPAWAGAQGSAGQAGAWGGQNAGGGAGGASLLRQPVLVVSQKAKLIELTNEYRIFDAQGNDIGAARQVGQSGFRKALRLVSNLDPILTARLEVVDAAGQPVLMITKPGALLRQKAIVAWPNGVEIGHIALKIRIGKSQFTYLDPGGRELGMLKAENWRAWDFRIEDASGREVGRVTKKWRGLGTELFTTADNYVVEIDPSTPDPLRTLAIGSSLAIDTILKQQSG